MAFHTAFHTRRDGFSLIELMIVLAIAGILIAVGVTNYANWARRESVRAGARDVAMALQRAKGQAVKRGRNTILSFNAPAANSYQIVDDANNNCVADGGETVLFQSSLPTGVTSLGAGITFTNANAAFDPRGLPLGDAGGACVPFGVGGAAGLGAVTLQMAGVTATYVVSMNLTGGITVARQ